MYPPSIWCTLKLTTMVNGTQNAKQLRSQVLNLYKTLLYYGRDYPLGYKYFRDRCHKAFVKNRDENDPQQIIKHISRGEFVIKELEALYRLRKYRYLKQRYYPEKNQQDDDYKTSIDPRMMLKKFETTQQQQQQQNTTAATSSATSSSSNNKQEEMMKQ